VVNVGWIVINWRRVAPADIRRHFFWIDHRRTVGEYRFSGAEIRRNEQAGQLPETRHARVEDAYRFHSHVPGDAGRAGSWTKPQAAGNLSHHAGGYRPAARHVEQVLKAARHASGATKELQELDFSEAGEKRAGPYAAYDTI